MFLIKTHASISRHVCQQILRLCPSTASSATHSHTHFVKLYKYLHCSRNSRLFRTLASPQTRSTLHTWNVDKAVSFARTISNGTFLSNPVLCCCASARSTQIPCIHKADAHHLQSLFQTINHRCYATSKTKDDDPASPDSQAFCDYLAHLVNEYGDISTRLETDESLTDKDRRRLRQRELEMRHLVDVIQELDKRKMEMKEIENLIKGRLYSATWKAWKP